MPMMGGEMAAEAVLQRRPAQADGEHDLGWVADWLYGDAALPPGPLPPREPRPEPRRWLPPAGAPALVRRPPAPPGRPRRARQLALL
jgi:hypothetical protein